MGIVSSLLERRGVSVVGDHLWRSINTSIASTGGVGVTPDSAMRLTAVWSCVGILSQTLASLPLITYSRRNDGGKDRALNLPLFDTLHDAPNPEMSSFGWREAMMTNQLLWGNAYSRIDESEGGLALWPLYSAFMRAERDRRGQLRYQYDEPGRSGEYPADQLLRVPGRSYNGVNGLGAIAYHAQSLGLGLAAQEFGTRFFANDATPGFTLSTDQALPKDAVDRIKSLWVEAHQGLDKAGAPAVLHSGLKPVTIGMPLRDAQFLEIRKFQVTEIARIFGVPPHLIGDLERATFANVEHQSIEYVVIHLRPWLVRWEQAIKQQLLTRQERKKFFVEFLVDGLLRGDAKARADALAIQRQNGIINGDDWRALENMNPIPDGSGRHYLVNGNMIPISQAANQGDAGDGDPASRGSRAEVPMTDRVSMCAELIRAGFDADASRVAVGLPEIRHLGPLPITVKTRAAIEAEGKPAPAPAKSGSTNGVTTGGTNGKAD